MEGQLGSFADMLNLANSGKMSASDLMACVNNNKEGGAGGNSWWWIIILLLFMGGGTGGLFGNRGNTPGVGADTLAQLGLTNSDTMAILEKLNAMSASDCAAVRDQMSLVGASTNNLEARIQGVKDALAACCCDTRVAIEGVHRAIDNSTCQLNTAISNQTNLLQNQITQNQFSSLSEFSNLRNQMTTNQCEVLRAIQDNERNIIGWMTNEKIDTLRTENAQLAAQISQTNQTAVLVDAMRVITNPCPCGYGFPTNPCGSTVASVGNSK